MNPVGMGSGVDMASLISQTGLAATSQDAGMSVLKKSLDATASIGQALADQVSQVGRLSVYA